MSQSSHAAPQQRLRITFAKLGALKYIGHLDLAKTWERILRRAQLKLSYSQGFNARPRMQLAAPLSLGHTSEGELLDIWLDTPEPLDGLVERLNAVSPPGVPILQIVPVPLQTPSLPTLIESAEYTLTPRDEPMPELKAKIAVLMSEKRLLITRRGVPMDIKPLINRIEADELGKISLEMSLSTAGTGRPDELLALLEVDPLAMAVHRVRIKLRDVVGVRADAAIPDFDDSQGDSGEDDE
ncbi:MAG: hypothetical protein OHK0023_12850 [Anaerolineae bacterium]